MTIVRGALPRRHYTHIENETINDARLSYKALGMLTFLLSKPEGWRVNSLELAKGEGREGRDAIRSALKELRDTGYIKRRRFQDERGHWVTESTVYDVPMPDTPELQPDNESAGRTDDGFSGVGSPDVGDPGALVTTDSKYLIAEADSRSVDNCADDCAAGWVLDEHGVATACTTCNRFSASP